MEKRWIALKNWDSFILIENIFWPKMFGASVFPKPYQGERKPKIQLL